MKPRLHQHHCPAGRKPKALDTKLVKVVEPTESGLLVSLYPVPRKKA